MLKRVAVLLALLGVAACGGVSPATYPMQPLRFSQTVYVMAVGELDDMGLRPSGGHDGMSIASTGSYGFRVTLLSGSLPDGVVLVRSPSPRLRGTPAPSSVGSHKLTLRLETDVDFGEEGVRTLSKTLVIWVRVLKAR